jgi:hypothetical protein
MTAEQIVDLADSLNVTPSEVERAIALMRCGRGDLITEVTNGRMTVRAALAAARADKGA